MVPHLTYLEAVIVGLLQGVTELFPVSSLGHSILIPALIGGDWARNLNMAADGSPYLAFLVAVHVAHRRGPGRVLPPRLGAYRPRPGQLDPPSAHRHCR